MTRAYAKGRIKSRGMNKTEAKYAQYLEMQKRLKHIQWWAFEPFNLRLADNTYYRPDFLVLNSADELEVYDVKGRKMIKDKNGNVRESYFCMEDSKIKIKIAAETFPFRFFIVWPRKDGSWGSEEIGE